MGGAWIIDPSPHDDERGRFMRAWCVREFEDDGIRFSPVQATRVQPLQGNGPRIASSDSARARGETGALHAGRNL